MLGSDLPSGAQGFQEKVCNLSVAVCSFDQDEALVLKNEETASASGPAQLPDQGTAAP